jgi:bifunctional non-homologous end joining protein LigD
MSKKTELKVGGRTMMVSNIDKVLYPEVGFTKGEVIDYYFRIAPVLLPHLKARPITLKRYPDGVNGFFFYEKQCPSHRPKWVKTTTVTSQRKEGKIDYCVMNDLPALVWAANLANLELHTFLHKAPSITRPTMMAFDLDPGAPANIVQCCQVALWLRDVFDGFGLQRLPQNLRFERSAALRPVEYSHGHLRQDEGVCVQGSETARTRAPGANCFADAEGAPHRKGAYRLEPERRPQDDHCVYSLRAKAQPTVSTPITWEEVEKCLQEKNAELLPFHQPRRPRACTKPRRPLRARAETQAAYSDRKSFG